MSEMPTIEVFVDGCAIPNPGDAGAVWSGREVEKAETAAIGRALGHAGYGTQFEADDEGDHLADSPVERKQSQQKSGPKAQAPSPATTPTITGATNGGSPDEPIITPSWIDTEGAWLAFQKSALDKLKLTSKSVEAALEEFSSMKLADWTLSRGWALAAVIAFAFDYQRDRIGDYTSTMPGDESAKLDIDRMAQTIAIKYAEGQPVP